MKKDVTKINMRYVLAIILIAVGIQLSAQVNYKLDGVKSSMTIIGTSTIHDWEMNVEDLKGDFVLSSENNFGEFASGHFTVNVTSIKSEHSLMNKKAYDALKEDDHPQIKVKVVSVAVFENKLKTTFDLNIAGKTNKLTKEFNYKINNNGSIEIQGSVDLKMSDFDVEPPVALMGTIKTGDEIKVSFKLIYNKK